MERGNNSVRKKARVTQGIIGLFCIAMLAFAGVVAFDNAVKGFKDTDSSLATADISSEAAPESAPDSSEDSDDNSQDSAPDSSADSLTESSGAESTAEMSETEIADDFADAVFIGNSRTVGLGMNCGKPMATFYASTGLNVQSIWESDTIMLDNGNYGTVFDALGQKQFGRVYIMFGINEIGWPYWDSFRDKYEEVVNKIKELQPDAKIYVQSILPVSYMAVNTNEVFTTANVDGLNEFVKEVAADTGTTYLDVNSVLRQEDGSLPSEASTDGIHLIKDYCLIWLKYLADNT